MEIHQTAIVHPKAELADDVVIGPYSIIGEHVTIGQGVKVASHVVVEGWTEIGQGCVFHPFSSIGAPPQDLKYRGEVSRVTIGQKNIFREFVTVNRGTHHGGGATTIGDGNFFMAYVHIAHDCHIGHHVIMANAATLAGHITIDNHAVIGGLVGVHQFVRIGSYSLIGGCSAVGQDVPPFLCAAGYRAKLYGLNSVGLKRHGFTPERIGKIKKAYRILFRSHLVLREAIKTVKEEITDSQDVEKMIKFLEASERGVCVDASQRG